MRRLVLTGVLALAACGGGEGKPAPADSTDAMTNLPSREDYLNTAEGRVWYRVTGSTGGTPVILIHGGPGFPSYYMKPLEALAVDRPVVRYDQLGAGKSDRITGTHLDTIPRFVDNLEALRAQLGYDKVFLYGLSWGTIVAVEYYRAHPEHVAGLVLGGAALDIPAWEKHAQDLVKTLSDSAQRAIAQGQKTRDYHSPAYAAAEEEFYGKYVWRRPVMADLESTMAQLDTTVYNYMQGPNEFVITGTLKNYSARAILPLITVPVLYTTGEFDEAGPDLIKGFAALTPGAKVEVFKDAAHLTPWDATDENVRVVREFLAAVDTVGQ